MIPLELQVPRRELAKELKKLGLKQERDVLYWQLAGNNITTGSEEWPLRRGKTRTDGKAYAALTVPELGVLLPQIISINGKSFQLFISVGLDKQWFVVYVNEMDLNDNAPFPFMLHHSEADARASMLIYLVKNGYVKF